MASYSSVNGEKVHAHRWLLTDLLKGELGFPGFVVSDHQAVDQVDPDYRTAVVRCLDAGIDMVMVPYDHERFRTTVEDAVRAGDLSSARLDDAVRRILRVKEAMGLLDPEPEELPDPMVVGSADHRQLARRAAAAGAVLLTDRAGVVPLPAEATVLVAGAAADDVGLACGGWTIEWGGAPGAITPGTTLVQGLAAHLGDRLIVTGATAEDPSPLRDRTATVGIAVVHEQPYAEGFGDREHLALDAAQCRLVQAVADRVSHTILVVVAGRPLVLADVEPLVDAVVVAWLPGSQAAGIADVLVGANPFTGTLPVTWPAHDLDDPAGDIAALAARWPRGHGVTPPTPAPDVS
jgi:beta-glucosidase